MPKFDKYYQRHSPIKFFRLYVHLLHPSSIFISLRSFLSIFVCLLRPEDIWYGWTWQCFDCSVPYRFLPERFGLLSVLALRSFSTFRSSSHFGDGRESFFVSFSWFQICILCCCCLLHSYPSKSKTLFITDFKTWLWSMCRADDLMERQHPLYFVFHVLKMAYVWITRQAIL